MVTREEILKEIQRLAAENGGKTVGRERFFAETSIKAYDIGRYWVKWNDAVEEAGLSANAMQSRTQSDDEILSCVADFALELGHFPTTSEGTLKRHGDPSFPSVNTLRTRIGTRQTLLRRVADFAAANPSYAAVVAMCESKMTSESDAASQPSSNYEYVYLIRMDKWYKVGKTNDMARRQSELGRQLPEEGVEVHRIKTDDPFGVESYWLNRFEPRRTDKSKSDWFRLTPADVKAFKRWTKIY
jgi:hypothetical protein